MDKILIVISVFFFSQSFASHPLPVLTVASEEWQEYTNVDGTGTYWDIVREVYGEHYQLEFISTSWSRAINLVETGRADVLVGTYKDTSRQLIYPQHHLDIEYPLYAVFDKKTQSINKADDLAGLIVAGKKDYALERFLPSTSRFYGVEYIDNITRLIDKKRVDVAVTYLTNLPLADPENRFSHHIIGKEERLYLAFTDSKKGDKLQKTYDKKIIKLVKDNKLQQYFLSEAEYQHAQYDTLLSTPKKVLALK
jgi:polar amino acid transport system substrate-binding protein